MKALLVESDKSVADDIGTSLKLAECELSIADSFRRARQLLVEEHPSVVLTRVKVGEEQVRELIHFLDDLAKHEAFKALPLLAIGTAEELEQVDSIRSRFTGTLVVPVEFPTFTESFRNLMSGPKLVKPVAEGEKKKSVSPPVTETSVAPEPERTSTPKTAGPAAAAEMSPQDVVLGSGVIFGQVLHMLSSEVSQRTVRKEEFGELLLDFTRKACEDGGVRSALRKMLSQS